MAAGDTTATATGVPEEYVSTELFGGAMEVDMPVGFGDVRYVFGLYFISFHFYFFYLFYLVLFFWNWVLISEEGDGICMLVFCMMISFRGGGGVGTFAFNSCHIENITLILSLLLFIVENGLSVPFLLYHFSLSSSSPSCTRIRPPTHIFFLMKNLDSLITHPPPLPLFIFLPPTYHPSISKSTKSLFLFFSKGTITPQKN